MFLLLAGRKANRNGQAWTILIPLGLAAAIWRVPLAIFGMSPGDWESLGIFFLTVAMGLSVVCLLGDWLARRHLLWRLVCTLGLMLGVAAVSYCLHFESAWSEEPSYLIMIGGSTVVLAGSFALTGLCCRGVYGVARLLMWQVAWTGALTMLGFMSAITIEIVIRSGQISQLPFILLRSAILPLMGAAILYVILLPFLIVCFKCPLYNERLEGMLGLKKTPRNGKGTSPFMDEVPLSSEPTTKPVAIGDVVGRWSFYLDRLSRTVVLDFLADGSFVQTIHASQGEVQEHQGEAWRLEGSLVHLEGYTSAADATLQSRTWWMVETPAGLRLFGGDDPERMFPLHRVEMPTTASSG